MGLKAWLTRSNLFFYKCVNKYRKTRGLEQKIFVDSKRTLGLPLLKKYRNYTARRLKILNNRLRVPKPEFEPNPKLSHKAIKYKRKRPKLSRKEKRFPQSQSNTHIYNLPKPTKHRVSNPIIDLDNTPHETILKSKKKIKDFDERVIESLNQRIAYESSQQSKIKTDHQSKAQPSSKIESKKSRKTKYVTIMGKRYKNRMVSSQEALDMFNEAFKKRNNSEGEKK